MNTRKAEKIEKKIEHLIHKNWPVEAIQVWKKEKPDREIARRLHNIVQTKVNQAKSLLKDVEQSHVNAPASIIRILQNGIDQTQAIIQQSELYEKKFFNPFKGKNISDIENAYNLAVRAQKILRESVQSFNSAYRQHQAAQTSQK